MLCCLIVIIIMSFRKPASGSGHYNKGLRQYCLKRECLLNNKSNFKRRDGMMLKGGGHYPGSTPLLSVALYESRRERLCEQAYFHPLPSREKADLVLEDSKQLSLLL